MLSHRLFCFLLLIVASSFANAILPVTPPVENPNEQTLELSITELGFQPNIVNADPDKAIILKVTRKTKAFCMKSLEILAQSIHQKLPLNKPVYIKLGKVPPGEIKLGCRPELKEGGLIYVK